MTFTTVGVIGAGTMGAGIATALAQQGVTVRLADMTSAAAERGAATARAFYAKAVDKAKMTPQAAADASARLSVASGWTDLSDCALVIEAVFEEFAVKAELFKALNPVLRRDAVIATNTSALRVSDLAREVDCPGRFLGLHFFNPAAINPIVEVVRGAKTDSSVYDRCLAFCRAIGKRPIACKDSFGFAINRFFIPYGNEAMRLWDEKQGSMAQIDRVAQARLEVAAGPFVVMNLVKPRIMYQAQHSLAPHGGFYALAPTFARRKQEDYQFDIAADTVPENLAHDALIADRLRAAVFLPVLQALDEAVASPEDIDAGAELALRFGQPPCRLMDSLGRDEVTRIVRLATEPYGHAAPKSLSRVGHLRS